MADLGKHVGSAGAIAGTAFGVRHEVRAVLAGLDQGEGELGELLGFEVDFEFEAVGEEGLLHEGDLLALLRKTWLENMERHLQSGGVTVAVVNMDMLIESGGFLDELRARGYTVDAP